MVAVRTKFDRTPKVLRSDRGGEYTGRDVEMFLRSNGIQIQHTTAYTPQQNGVAERKNRSLMEMAQCMLIEADMPYKYWAEAVATANFTQNRLYSRAIDGVPIKLWCEMKPTVDVFHVFGAAAYVFVPKEKRDKLQNKSKLMTFVGYDCKSKAYRMLDQETLKI